MLRWWEEHVLPRVVDRLLDVGEVHKLRARACAGLEGRVLEIGFGSGLNVQHYPAAVTEVAGVEPNHDAWKLAGPRIAESPVTVRRSGLDGQHLAEDDESFDTALSTFTLCTIPDHDLALREVHRVLRPGGELHFLEHGLAGDARVERWQHRIEPIQRRVGGGCHLTRQPAEAAEAAGFEVLDLEAGYLPGPSLTKVSGYVYLGRARKS